jgi:hypothetical protein
VFIFNRVFTGSSSLGEIITPHGRMYIFTDGRKIKITHDRLRLGNTTVVCGTKYTQNLIFLAHYQERF